MAGVSAGSTALIDALARRARTEIGELAAGAAVSMTPGAEFPRLDQKLPTEKTIHLQAAKWRDAVADTDVDSENVMTAAREIALLAAHERAVQRMAMSRMRCIALYRLRLKSRTNLLMRGISEGLVPL